MHWDWSSFAIGAFAGCFIALALLLGGLLLLARGVE
jgi:hypothetical protein